MVHACPACFGGSKNRETPIFSLFVHIHIRRSNRIIHRLAVENMCVLLAGVLKCLEFAIQLAIQDVEFGRMVINLTVKW